MNSLTKGIIVIAIILGIGAGLVYWKANYGNHHGGESLNTVSKEDMTMLLKDADPSQLQAISSNPEAKAKIAENIKQLLAVASQARKDGLDKDPNVATELESTRAIVTASLYDKQLNKGKGPMPPFSFITEDQIKEYAAKPGFDEEFQKFLDAKIALAKESGRFPDDKKLTDDEIKNAKDDYAKIKIYEEEAEAKKSTLGDEFERNLELQVKLQQASFLASRYAQKVLKDKAQVTDEEVNKYIADHPDKYNVADKKAQAEKILSRAKAGEDFGKLADEFSDDPGTKGKGGLYEGVTMGKMVPAFEQAALALQPGQVADSLVETPFGYHIIKLEKKGETKGPDGQAAPTYDVRHILIGTTMTDPSNPMARPMPIAEQVRTELEKDKQKQILDEIVKNNPVEVAEDFTIPPPSPEQLPDAQEQQQQMRQQMSGGDEGMPVGPPPPNGKPPVAPNGRPAPPRLQPQPR